MSEVLEYLREFNTVSVALRVARAERYLKERNRVSQIFTMGQLNQNFGTRNGQLPCALCCSGRIKPICTPYYVEEGS